MRLCSASNARRPSATAFPFPDLSPHGVSASAPRVDEALPALRRLLEAAGGAYRLVGGVAVVHHGYGPALAALRRDALEELSWSR